jgi:uncharacterized protein YciI
MKLTVSFLIMVIFCFPVLGQSGSPYDAELANKLGADDYGMKTYVMAFLQAGDSVSKYSQQERAEIQKGHMANINRLAEMGKLILAGPFINGGEKRGIFIFDVASKAEAEELTNTDPAVQAGVLKMELVEWYGSAALMMIPEWHEKVQKTGF